MLTAKDFDMTGKYEHPYEMLDGYKHATEKEATLVYILQECAFFGDLNATITVHHQHPDMVDDGLLVAISDYEYKLTDKAIELLHKYYCRPMDVCGFKGY